MLTACYLDSVDLKEWVRAERERRGWTQQQLADAAGIDRVEANALETGRNKGTSARIREGLAKAFRIRIEQVGGDTNTPAPVAGGDSAFDGMPVFRNLPGWDEREAEVLKHYRFEPAEIRRARTMRAQVSPTAGATFDIVLHALQLARAMPPEEIIAATNAAVDKRIEKVRKTAETKLRKQREQVEPVSSTSGAVSKRSREK